MKPQRGGHFERGRGGRGRGYSSNTTRRPNKDIRKQSTAELTSRPAPSEGELNAHLSERIRKQNRGDTDSLNKTQSEPPLTLNHFVAKYARDQIAISKDAAEGDWHALPEIPPASELLVEDDYEASIPPNKINGLWSKKERYLRSHYKLLREDATASLRESLDKVRKDAERMDDNDTKIYEKVHISDYTFCHKGIAARISFSTQRSGRKIVWENSKRLTSGSLVALSSDKFQSECIPAIVAARPLENLQDTPPKIDIFFGSCEDIEVDSQKSFLMVEASQGYFEAYRHTLLALQKQSKESFPLSEHICLLKKDIEPPKYLTADPKRNLSSVTSDVQPQNLSNVDILKMWPAVPQDKLDQSQWSAMHQLLTKRLAIIQGPPGTGKTHFSQMALEVLVNNRKPGDPPIIIACQTNHALDQLLALSSSFDSTYIRLGGRSSNIEVKKRALFEVRKQKVIDRIPGSCFTKSAIEIRFESRKLQQILSPLTLNSDDDSPALMSGNDLEKLGVISSKQHENLQKGASEWVLADDFGDNPIQSWLGNSLVPFRVTYRQEDFGFEAVEEDLELEQLKELEAEHGVTDEEDLEMLKGDFVKLSAGFTMPQPTFDVMEKAKQLLNTQIDLWRIPDHLRGPVYLVMQEKAKQVVKLRFREAASKYIATVQRLQVGKWERDCVYLQEANIIGCTTSGLAKYRNLLSSLQPKILLIEEASEVLEAAVTVGCMESLEHLILVGDHLQLQASCSVQELAGDPYWLNISMFERLVRNGMPHKTLLRQRRMDPFFRKLISPMYPGLDDHESVINRPIIPWGTGQVRYYFFNHELREMRDESMSTYNEYEARFVAKFYRHLIRNGVPPAAITVLTFYNGQRKKILKELKGDEETRSIYNKVKTVDSFQGEENHVIILSLVRCNDTGKIGFLDINNRVVVALSRAKFGFYLFGNAGFLAQHNELWDLVEVKMKQAGRLGRRLPITCTNHGNTLYVEHPEDFDDTNGGCKQPCGSRLDCGHRCDLKCHPFPHENVTCHEVCRKLLACGHNCVQKCYETCICKCNLFEQLNAETPSLSFHDAKLLEDVGRHEQQNIKEEESSSYKNVNVARGVGEWQQYAFKGGVIADDQRRSQTAQAQYASLLQGSTNQQDSQNINSQHKTDQSESGTSAKAGRKRYVQQYGLTASNLEQLANETNNLSIGGGDPRPGQNTHGHVGHMM